MNQGKAAIVRLLAARIAGGQKKPRRCPPRGRRPACEQLEDRLVPSAYSLTAVDDGFATDKNLDGVFESLDRTSSMVQMELYPPVYNIGEERGLVQFNLSSVPAGTTITSAQLLGYIPSFGFQNSIQVNISFFGYAGSGTVAATDATNVSQSVGTLANVTSTGQFATPIDTSFLQTMVNQGQRYVGLTMTVPSGTNVSMDSLNDPPPVPQYLTLQINYDQNHAPVAVNDTYSTNENQSLTVAAPGLLANDSDADGDPLKVVIVSLPSHDASASFSTNGSFTYTPQTNFYGTDSFSYKLFDGFTYSNVATVTINVNGSDSPPTAKNEAYVTPTNTALTVAAPGVLANDTDANNDPLTAVLATSPAHGSVTLNSDGSFTYTPGSGYHGTDTFTYVANDGTLNSNPATVAVTVNDSPTANADSYALNENSTLTVAAPGVLGNDTDPNGDPLTASLYSSPSHGTLKLNNDGSFTYTPNTNYTGGDSFIYRASDGYSFGNLATVTLTVNAVNQPPVATNDNYGVPQDGTLTVAAPGVLGNDTDAEKEALSASLVSPTAHGALALNADGSFTYTPAAGYDGYDAFTYQVSDPTAAGNTATVTIKVDAPPAAADDSYTTNENTKLSVAAPGVLGNDTDPDGDSLTASVVANPAHGSVVLNSNGTFTYTPNTYFYGADSFTYKAFDGVQYSNVATVTVTVNHVNQPPTPIQDSYSTTEDTPLTVAAAGVLSNDTDPDKDPLTAVLATAPANGTVVFNADGSFTYTPNKDFSGTDRFYYEASDGQFLSAATPVFIAVKAVNDAPVANNDTFSLSENGSLTIAPAGAGVTSLVMNSQPGDYIGGGQSYDYTPATGIFSTSTYLAYGSSQNAVEVSYHAPDYSHWWYLDFAAPYGQVLTPGTYLNATRWAFEDIGQAGLDVSGDGRGSNTLTGQFTVLQAQYDPTGKALSFDATFVQHSEGATPALTGEIKYNAFTPAAGVLANDTDAESNALTATLVNGPAHGTLSFNPDGTFSYTPDPYFYGTDSFTYQASDGSLTGNTATVTLNVAKVNHPPAAADDSYITNEATPLTVAGPGVLANDSDPEGDPLTAALVTGPAHGKVALNADGSFTYTPEPSYYGADSFTYRANDGTADSNTATVNLTVNPVSPQAADDSYTMNEGATLGVAAPGVLGNDTTVGGQALTAALVSGPAHGTLALNADGSFVYTPDTYYYGSDSFTYQNNDGQFDSNTATVTITVNHVNHPPVAVAGPDQTVNEGDTVAFDGSQSSDVDGDPLTFSWDFGDGSTATGAQPTHVYSDEGTYTVTLTADDGHGGQSKSTLKVTVNDVPPTLTLSGDGSVNEGATYTLGLSASDPYGGPVSGWQINWGDGTSQTVSGNPSSVTHVYADGPNDFVISATATDAEGTYSAGNTVAVQVNNLAPFAGVGGPTDGVRGQARTFTLSAADVPADQGNFAFHIVWGDGSAQDVSGPSGTTVDHTFTGSGAYTVQVTATDKDGGASSPATLGINVVAAEMQGTTLVVGGTVGGDTIVIQPTDTAGDVSVTINGQSQGTFKPSKVIVFGQAGDDSIRLNSISIGHSTVYMNLLAELFGSDGNDSLSAGGNQGSNLLLGGNGNDSLQGGARSVLIGGLGADTLIGGNNDDILIGGTTDFDNNLTALDAIMAEWGRTDLGYSGRVNDLNGTSTTGKNNGFYLNTTTVHDDGAVDQLTGSGGNDWFFALTSGPFADPIHDLKKGEVVTHL